MIKLTGGGTGGGGEQVSPGPGLPPPVSPEELNDTTDNTKAGSEAISNFVPNATDATMSFVLQLGNVETSEEVSNNNTSVLAQELTGSIPVGGGIVKPLVASNNNKPQSLQNLKTVNLTTVVSAGSGLPQTVKPVTVTYPVNKTVRDAQRIGGSQTNTTQVLTTRVISQKLPPSTFQIHPNTLPLSTAHALHLPIKSSLPSPGSNVPKIQSLPSPTFPQNVNTAAKIQPAVIPDAAQTKQQMATITNLQTNMQQKLQVSTSQILATPGVKTITATTTVPNIHRIQVKSQGIGSKPQTVSLQKVKTITNVNNQSGQRANLPRIQTVPKAQVLTPSTQTTQVSMSQVMNSANMQRVQQQINSSGVVQHMQKVHQPLTVNNAQKNPQIFNSQKVQSQIISNATTHGMQKVQHSGLQQAQITQKNQGVVQKALGVQRQQQSNAVNNISKTVNSVAGIQKLQANTQQQQKNVQTQQQRPQTTAALQKSQTLAAVNSNKSQTVSNITKSNSVPNISKLQQNQNLLNATKQQMTNQPQQQQQQQTQGPQLSQLQQQLMHQNPQQQQQQQQQIVQKQQQQMNVVSQTQRSQTITGMQQKMATITSLPNNQRVQTTVNSKSQQQQQQQQPQMLLRVGPTKNQSQNIQQGNLKPVSQKMMNSVKPLNAQNATQQFNRTVNSQPVKIIQQQQQQQQQNIIGPQNTQKQPGCIKTIPPQKPAQRNHLQKMAGIKTSLNTNLSSLKGQGTPTTIAQKSSIKTLLPQQSSGQNIMAHKNQPVKIQQQIIQQKQLVMTAQYPQQIRNQAGQIKTLLPVVSGDNRRENDNK